MVYLGPDFYQDISATWAKLNPRRTYRSGSSRGVVAVSWAGREKVISVGRSKRAAHPLLRIVVEPWWVCTP